LLIFLFQIDKVYYEVITHKIKKAMLRQ